MLAARTSSAATRSAAAEPANPIRSEPRCDTEGDRNVVLIGAIVRLTREGKSQRPFADVIVADGLLVADAPHEAGAKALLPIGPDASDQPVAIAEIIAAIDDLRQVEAEIARGVAVRIEIGRIGAGVLRGAEIDRAVQLNMRVRIKTLVAMRR